MGASLLLLLGIKKVRRSESLDSRPKGFFEQKLLSQDFTVLIEECLEYSVVRGWHARGEEVALSQWAILSFSVE